ncbi:hypothetical protein BDD12DRAFT_663468, partial [Trichophaea hybrida]
NESNELVNMPPDDLKNWLKTSKFTGVLKPLEHSGETVGHDSGRHIVSILKKNPNKVPVIYAGEDIQRMRK